MGPNGVVVFHGVPGVKNSFLPLLSLEMATDSLPKKKGREKVALRPGFHLTDWVRLTKERGDELSGRNGAAMRKISRDELKEHKSKYDAWTAYAGKVYNITPYMAYHPGGEKMLMAGAGKDSTKLFDRYHAWVNMDNLMSKCMIGILMSDEAAIEEGDEDEEEDGDDEGKIGRKEEKEEKRGEGLQAKALDLLSRPDSGDEDEEEAKQAEGKVEDEYKQDEHK